MTRYRRTAALASALVLTAVTHAAPTIYYNRALFLADGRTGATTTEGLDGFAPGTDLTNATLGAATFQATGSEPLEVILGATGVRFSMSPSSGTNVLSPGGSDTSLEEDDLRIVFSSPVQAAGMDVVFDAPDGLSFVGVTFRDASGAVIATDGFIPSPTGAPGYQFVGLVTDSASIQTIEFDEFDPTPDDDHVAYDTLTYSGTPVPEPLSLAVLGLGFGTMALRRRKK